MRTCFIVKFQDNDSKQNYVHWNKNVEVFKTVIYESYLLEEDQLIEALKYVVYVCGWNISVQPVTVD